MESYVGSTGAPLVENVDVGRGIAAAIEMEAGGAPNLGGADAAAAAAGAAAAAATASGDGCSITELLVRGSAASGTLLIVCAGEAPPGAEDEPAVRLLLAALRAYNE